MCKLQLQLTHLQILKKHICGHYRWISRNHSVNSERERGRFITQTNVFQLCFILMILTYGYWKPVIQYLRKFDKIWFNEKGFSTQKCWTTEKYKHVQLSILGGGALYRNYWCTAAWHGRVRSVALLRSPATTSWQHMSGEFAQTPWSSNQVLVHLGSVVISTLFSPNVCVNAVCVFS